MEPMRAVGVIAVLILMACGPTTSAGAVHSNVTPPPPATAVVSLCRLPVWWGGAGGDVHAGFVSVPDGTFTDAGVLPLGTQINGLGGAYGGAYIAQRWVRAGRPAVSPDGSRYAYWTADPSHGEVHVVDVASGSDRVAYSGATQYIIVGYESDAIYLAHIINARQGAFEHLYRLDPAGGTPQLVLGSDRHMYQWGWVLVADGAAWGIDNRVSGTDYIYSVLRLDLATGQVTEWMEGPQGKMFWPLGVDAGHRLYAAPYAGPLWRVERPGQPVELPTPAQTYFSGAIGGPSSFASDAVGVWISGQGSIWLYADGNDPKQFTVGSPGETTYPAGTCLS